MDKEWRRGRELNPRIPVLQTSALPLCYLARLFPVETNDARLYVGGGVCQP